MHTLTNTIYCGKDTNYKTKIKYMFISFINVAKPIYLTA